MFYLFWLVGWLVGQLVGQSAGLQKTTEWIFTEYGWRMCISPE